MVLKVNPPTLREKRAMRMQIPTVRNRIEVMVINALTWDPRAINIKATPNITEVRRPSAIGFALTPLFNSGPEAKKQPSKATTIPAI